MTSRPLLAAALALVAIAHGSSAAPNRLPGLLDKAAAYLERLESECATIIAQEEYRQHWHRGWRPSGLEFAENRRLDSEMLFVWVPADHEWLAVRDVRRIDDRELPDAERPLKLLLESRLLVSTTRLRDLLRENSRYNLGWFGRNFNDPTLGLLPLQRALQPRFKMSLGDTGERTGRPTIEVRFDEQQRPTLINRSGQDVFMKGVITIDEKSGAIVRSRVVVSVSSPSSRAELTTTFERSDRFGVWLPSVMKEEYWGQAEPQQSITATARYSNYRRFETAGRIVPE